VLLRVSARWMPDELPVKSTTPAPREPLGAPGSGVPFVVYLRENAEALALDLERHVELAPEAHQRTVHAGNVEEDSEAEWNGPCSNIPLTDLRCKHCKHDKGGLS